MHVRQVEAERDAAHEAATATSARHLQEIDLSIEIRKAIASRTRMLRLRKTEVERLHAVTAASIPMDPAPEEQQLIGNKLEEISEILKRLSFLSKDEERQVEQVKEEALTFLSVYEKFKVSIFALSKADIRELAQRV